jgi:outer membrane protein assembly factor BamB
MIVTLTTPRISLLLVLVALLTCFGCRPAVDGPSWTRFHGPNHDNKSMDTGLLKQWPEGGPERLWTASGLGHGFSSVTIANGRIFVSGNIDDRSVVSALDSATGQILWQTPNGKAWMDPHPGTRGTPTVDGNRLYDESPFGELICLNASSGKKIWRRNILDDFEGENICWGLSESVLIDGDRVICCPGGKTSMVALDKRNGKVVWRAPSIGEGPGYATPTLAEYQGLRIILTLSLKSMIGVNADTGELLWQVQHETYSDENVFQPLYHEGHVFVSTVKTGSVKWKINVNGRSASVEEVWRSDEMDNHHGHVILLDGFLYGSSCIRNRGKWICLDWNTGEMKYAVKGVGKTAHTYADGMLYTLNKDRVVSLVKPTPTAPEIVSRFELPSQGEGPSWAHPVVCGRRLYLRHGEYLYAYDVRAPTGSEPGNQQHAGRAKARQSSR